MRQGIVLASSEGRESWVENFISNSPKQEHYPVHIIIQNNFELGAIRKALDTTDLDEFIFLHDTCEVKSYKLYKFCFQTHEGESVSFSDHPSPIGMYLGKYKRSVLNKINFQIPTTKLEAVESEISFPIAYAQIEPLVYIPYPLRNGNNFVTKGGRLNMKLENDLLVKYKATWNRNML